MSCSVIWTILSKIHKRILWILRRDSNFIFFFCKLLVHVVTFFNVVSIKYRTKSHILSKIYLTQSIHFSCYPANKEGISSILATVLLSKWNGRNNHGIIDEILKSLARGTKTVTREYSNTTAQPASCHQASLTHSNQLNINHSLAKIAYE